MKTAIYSFAFFLFGCLLFLKTIQAAPFAYVANNASASISVIDLATNTVSNTLNTGDFPYRSSFNPNGEAVYVSHLDFTAFISVIDPSDNSISSVSGTGLVSSLAVSPTGSSLFAAIVGTLNINGFNINNNYSSLGSFAACSTSEVGSILPNRDGSLLYVACRDDNEVLVVDSTTLTVSETVTIAGSPLSLALSPDGSLLYVGNGAGIISTIDTADNTVSPSSFNIGGTSIYSMALNSTGTVLYAGRSSTPSAAVAVDTSTGIVTNTLNLASNGTLISVQLNAAESFLYVVDQSNDLVNVVDLSDFSLETTVAVGDSPTSIAITPYANLSSFPTSLNFGEQAVGTSASQSVTLTNLGTGILNITGNSLSADFSQENDCGTSMVAYDTCTFTLTWTPTAAGTMTGSVTITSNSENGDLTIDLSGTATASGGGSGTSCSLASSNSSLLFFWALMAIPFLWMLRRKIAH